MKVLVLGCGESKGLAACMHESDGSEASGMVVLGLAAIKTAIDNLRGC